ncbi:MAG: LamG domain-containing protein, partial [Spirochaetales bacterium]|nr:LamG domain-containing protein [Spirochaetales bacterium]
VALFGGLIDEVRIWERAMTLEEIADNMGICMDGDETDLVAYFPFENGFTDESGSGNTMDTTGFGAVSPWGEATINCNYCGSDMLNTVVVDVLYSVHTTIDTEICEGESVTFGSQTLYTTGTYTEVYPAANGCDSVVQLNLLVHQPAFTTDVTEICEGDSVFIHGSYESIAGTYTDTLLTTAGCDSVVTIELIVNQPWTGSETVVICEGESALIFGNYETVAGTYTNTLQTVAGCDSVEVVELIVNPVYHIAETVSVPIGEAVTFPDGTEQTILSDMVVHNSILQTVNGCDSIVETTVRILADPPNGTCGTVLDFDGSNDYVSVPSYLHTNNQFTVEFWANVTSTESGWVHLVQNGAVENSFGCAYRVEIGPDGYAYCALGNGNSYNDGGYGSGFDLGWQYGEWNHYAFTYDGDTARVFMNGVQRIEFIAPGYNITHGDGTLLFGTFKKQSRYFNGKLDEVRIWDVARNEQEIFSTMLTQLTGAESGLMGYWDFNEGQDTTLTDLTSSGNNGDLINMDPQTDWLSPDGTPTHVLSTYSLCNGESVTVGTNTYTETGIYTDILSSANGCDSIVVTDVTVLPTFSETLPNIVINEGDSALIFGNYETVTGTYNEISTATNGCDSVTSITLIVGDAFVFNSNVEICEGDSALIFGNYETVAGTYTDSLLAVDGRDSIINVTLYITEPVVNYEDVDICEGDSVLIFGNYETTEGMYTDTLQTANGCDSVAVVYLLFLYPQFTSETIEICQGDSAYLAGYYETEPGIYTFNLQSATECDSIVTYEVIVHQSFLSEETIEI